MNDLIIIGAGGFGRETLDVVEAINQVNPTWNFIGFVDDGEVNKVLMDARNVKVIGNRHVLSDYSSFSFVVAISNPKIRRELVDFASNCGLNLATLIHPKALVGSEVTIESGSIICAGVSITTNIRVGNNSQLNPGVLIGHDTELEDFVSIYPGAVIGGNVHIGGNVTIGANVTVLQGLSVGDDSMVGAGAVVTKSIPAQKIAKGIPANW